MIYLLFFMCLSFNVLAYTDGGSYSDAPQKSLRQRVVVVSEPVVRIERYDVSLLKNDPSVLVSKLRVIKEIPSYIEKPVEVIKVQANPMADVHDNQVKVSATISSDTEEETNYPLRGE